MVNKLLFKKICPFCRTLMTDDEDIVLCSRCEMPHHQDCWILNKGCTTFGCDGTIQSSDTSTEDDEIIVITIEEENTNDLYEQFCVNCGEFNPSEAKFCRYCKMKL